MNLLGNFTLTQLEYVIALHKFGHFGKAAQACNVTQPTLSTQIQKLEEGLDIVIFDRSKKPILVTDIGAQIIAQIKTVLTEARKIDHLASARVSAKPEGELLLGVIPSVAPYVLPKLFLTLSQKFPSLRLIVHEVQTQSILESIENDELDVGLLATSLKDSPCFEYPLFYDPFYLLCNSHHPFSKKARVDPASLSSDDIWLLGEGHCLRDQILDLCSLKSQKGKNNPFQFESGSLETLKTLVSNFRGYTLLPALATEEVPANTRLISFERPIPAREIGLVYRREHLKSHLIEALGTAVLESIPESLRKIRKKDLEILPVE